MEQRRIRNFCIIAHIDHGKSTLADRLLEETGLLGKGKHAAQYLDRMPLERERGITIKAQSVRLPYRSPGGEEYVLNLIDTPGHVDFSYEVSRSLSACEGAVLLVDATQGVEAQTVANAYLAIDAGLEIIPAVNKIDLASADVEAARDEIAEVVGLSSDDALLLSAKLGTGVAELLQAVVNRVPAPAGDPDAPLRALIFDSWFDNYRGAVALVRVKDGMVRRGMRIQLMSSGKTFEVQTLGVISPDPIEVDSLAAGEVGFMTANIKEVRDARVGDTVTGAERPAALALLGFKEVKPMVFAGLYPTDSDQYRNLADAMEKLKLNDASFSYDPESSAALGFGFRCGFLGLLHMEIIQERLEREFNLELITTAPTVAYRVVMNSGEVLTIENPNKLPSSQLIERIEEPYLRATIHLPQQYLGPVLKLCEDRRGLQKEFRYLSHDRVILGYELPLSEVVMEFYDRLKAGTKGYASLDYDLIGFRESDMVKLDVLINGEPVDALSRIVHRDKAYLQGKALVRKVWEVTPRQLFEVAIQASIGSRVIARETRVPLRKNVTAKCYGGDVSRKRKLLDRQKEGKKRMKQVGRVEIPQEAFLAVLKLEE
jgi:GTP-binding protein LepA